MGFPGSGFICLCPLGKHGQFCEYGKHFAVTVPKSKNVVIELKYFDIILLSGMG